MSEGQGSEIQEQNYGRSTLNYGEDYDQFLARSFDTFDTFDTDSSGSDICLVTPRTEGMNNRFVQVRN